MRAIQSVDDLQPLLDFCSGTLGELPGRLMVALSLLADLEYTQGWDENPPEAHLSVQLASALVADVFKHLLAEQSGQNLAAEIDALLARFSTGNGGDES